MWKENQKELTMTKGDYGVQLPVTVTGIEFTPEDLLKFTFKRTKNGTDILTKEYTPVGDTVCLEFTEWESSLFSPGSYVYSLDWYQGRKFMCNIIPLASFKVVEKA